MSVCVGVKLKDRAPKPAAPAKKSKATKKKK